MFRLEDTRCFNGEYEEEECLPSGQYYYLTVGSMDYWDEIDGSKSVGPVFHASALKRPSASPPAFPVNVLECDNGASLQARFSILDGWATTLHSCHVNGVIHGKLTPESVGVMDGRGTMSIPSAAQHLDHQVLWTREPSDDDVYGARWAATELFQINNGSINPTRMSDVYSFACLMLQMLTGEVPYCGTKRSEQVVYLKYLGREPIDTQTPKVADRYVAFMRWCWSPEAEKRPTMVTVVDFIQEEIKRLGEQRGQCYAAGA